MRPDTVFNFLAYIHKCTIYAMYLSSAHLSACPPAAFLLFVGYLSALVSDVVLVSFLWVVLVSDECVCVPDTVQTLVHSGVV